jgi:hypothetical protein
MPYRFNQLMYAVFVSSFAAPMFLCLNWDAWAASPSECVGRPDLSVNQAGHWHYHVDRVHHRRCWFFEPPKATVSPAASINRVPTQNTDSQQSWFSRLSTELAKTFSKQPRQSSVQQSSISAYSSEPPQNTVVDNSIVVATVRSDVVMRAGPGAEFSAIGHVPSGTELETINCIGGWCQVEFNAIAGFVGAADLGNDTAIRRSSARRAENRKLTSPKHLRTNKIVSRERSQIKPLPAMNGPCIRCTQTPMLTAIAKNSGSAAAKPTAFASISTPLLPPWAKSPRTHSDNVPVPIIAGRRPAMILSRRTPEHRPALHVDDQIDRQAFRG